MHDRSYLESLQLLSSLFYRLPDVLAYYNAPVQGVDEDEKDWQSFNPA